MIKSSLSRMVALAMLSGLLAGGCAAPPGDDKGFGSTGGTTEGEKRSREINLSAITEFTDYADELITEEIYKVPAIRETNTRLVLMLGNFSNKTSSTPTSDFEMFSNRLKNKLAANNRIKDRFIVQRDLGRMQEIMNRNAPAGPADLLQEGTGGSAQVNRYDPKITYVLNADFFEAVRSGKSQFYMVFTLDHLQSGQQVITAQRDLVQRR